MDADKARQAGVAGDVVPFGTAVRAWFAISLQTFGGPAGQIAVMQRALVEERRWIGQHRFLHALSFCMLLPGPEAHQLAVYVGWLLNGVRGGVVAGVLFVLPGVVAMLALSAVYVGLGDTTVAAGMLTGLGAAVVAIIAQAVVRVGRRALHQPLQICLAVGAFLALAVFGVPFPVVVGAGALLGWLASRRVPAWTSAVEHTGEGDRPPPLVPDDAPVPDVATVRPVPLVIAAVAALLIFVARWSTLRTLASCAVFGLGAGLAGLPVG